MYWGTAGGITFRVEPKGPGVFALWLLWPGPFIRPDGGVDHVRWALVDEDFGSIAAAVDRAREIVAQAETIDEGVDVEPRPSGGGGSSSGGSSGGGKLPRPWAPFVPDVPTPARVQSAVGGVAVLVVLGLLAWGSK